MPIFISYCHSDRDFVDRLARQLISHKVNVWLDRWELHAGDSLVAKIQQAITDASALLVILSPASVESEWCKKELNSGMMRELEERRVVVLPVLARHCDIPLLVRDKLYADFRTDFDKGLRTILEAIARVTNEWRNRLERPNWHTDWAIDWGETDNGLTMLRLTVVEAAESQPYCVVVVISLVGDARADKWYKRMTATGKDDLALRTVVAALSDELSRLDLRIRLEDQFPISTTVPFSIEQGDFRAVISTRWLGMDTGRDVLIDIAGEVCGITKQMQLAAVKPAE